MKTVDGFVAVTAGRQSFALDPIVIFEWRQVLIALKAS